MKIIEHLETLPNELRGNYMTIGKFDGVHRGHARILQRLTALAHENHSPSIVFTFDPLPVEMIRPHLAPPLLCTKKQKIELISRFEPDALFIYPTNSKLLNLSAQDFFEKIVLEIFGSKGLVEGKDFNFGKNRDGNANILQQLCSKTKIDLEIISPFQALGRDISSSRIRSLIHEGQIEAARGMLGRPYQIRGHVVHGEHRGRRLGYPTANLSGIQTILPKPGIYAAITHFENESFITAVNLGGNPTFGVQTIKFEANLFQFQGDLYGKFLDIDFISRIRDVIRFESKEALLQQIDQDRQMIEKVANEYRKNNPLFK
ncbi:MAG: bifunctional riboflavin kinase/FAD synthetase [Planctomycetia bacterium]|nr:bifunctional riboflavin kinase/FAD synthetase [Planctomycetia bacterium]